MNPASQYVLHPEVVFQERKDGEVTEYLVVRRGARVGGQGIGGPMRRLLHMFRTPITVLDAIIAHAQSEGDDPEVVLNEAGASLWRLVADGVLVDGDLEREALMQALRVDDVVNGARVVECVRLMEDFQVYRGVMADGSQVAIKLARETDEAAKSLLRREQRIVERLGGGVAPMQISFSEGPHPTLITSWCEGATIAHWLRTDRKNRLAIASRIVEAYSALHRAGVLHVDVNLNNVIVSDVAVHIIDFAGSIVIGEREKIPRLGVLAFQEPEYLDRAVRGRNAPPPTELGEQYSVACLIYRVLTGAPPIPVELDRGEAIARIVRDDPRPFSDHGILGMTEVERVVFRALEKRPSDRFPSMDEFARALVSALQACEVMAQSGPTLARELLKALSPGGPWYGARVPSRPRCSLNSGAGGISLALLELSIQRDDDRLLRLSGDWLAQAFGWMQYPDAFRWDETPRLAEIVDDGISILHTDVGLYWQDVLLREAGSVASSRDAAIVRLDQRLRRGYKNYDLTLGRAGNLAIAASILGRTGSPAIRPLGRDLEAEISALAKRSGRMGPGDGSGLNLGMAHGWAGIIWSMALWSRATGAELDSWVIGRAEELIAQGVERDGGLWWPWRMPEREAYVPGWCNGSAGFVLAFCELAVVAGERASSYLETAERAGQVVASTRWGMGHLCCGAAGGVYALVRLYQLTGNARWLKHAVRARDRALSLAHRHEDPASLFKGNVALMLLDVDAQALGGVVLPGFW